MIILGDIHGLDFWKRAVEGHETEEIIFLGDYLDPYPQEWGPYTADGLNTIRKQTIENFQEIIQFKKDHMKNVILLLGNHDCGYMVSDEVCSCRQDKLNYSEVRSLFRDNASLFKMAHYKEVNGKKILFTHAGLTRAWFRNNFPNVEITDTTHFADHINNEYELCIRESNYHMYTYLIGQVSAYRGGYDNFSSYIWTDLREFYMSSVLDGLHHYQIFGHTRLGDPFVGKDFAMLDAKRGFILNDDGILTEMDGTPLQIHNKIKETE